MDVTEPLKTIESPAEFKYLNIHIRPAEKNKSGQGGHRKNPVHMALFHVWWKCLVYFYCRRLLMISIYLF